ncbi:methylamine utilization protein MauE [Microtetraspora sp. NBRC 13810]|uniref:MauE/DoxX family redox-associated membrane protein n=1 Tax=Microtetraspora sp. NBRC 13810 TaxID=3030990 RepID=UPI0024A3CE74|nr:MauE/DoxX family redox-associated membrane protein [Microtetraspora sp. NBRC 13810]GLW11746.1 methylamine utilization protein MauE [Microtetraspora sp. NBRC 13810]
MQYAALACRCALAAVFLVALLSKVRSRDAFHAFRASVLDMVPLRAGAATPVSTAVVLAEASVVVLLTIRWTAPAGFVLAGAVLVAFCAGIARAVRSGTRTPCRCFGATATPLSGRHLVRNAVLLAVTAAGGTALLLTTPGTAHPGGVAVGLACAGVLTLAVVYFDDLADLFAGPPASGRAGL